MALLVGSGGCSGTVVGDDPGSAGGEIGGGGPGGSGVGPADPAACGKTPQIGPTPMRRLAHAEYDHTIRDLLGDATGPSREFPADSPAMGYDNHAGLTVSRTHATAYMDAAEAIARRAIADLTKLLPCSAAAAGEEVCATQFIQKFGRRAYRRPLDADEQAILVGLYRQARTAGDFPTAIRVVLQAILVAPQFLYRVEDGAALPVGGAGKLDDYALATRLSYLLWASTPDEALLDAAEAGRLRTPDGLATEVARLMADPRAHDGVLRFASQWVPTPASGIVPNKDTTVYRDFTPAVAELMRVELRTFLDHVAWQDGAKLKTFLTAPYTFMNPELARFYRKPGVTNPAFARVDVDVQYHAGVLSKGALLAQLAHANGSHPVARGKFVRDHLLCDPPPPPPPDVNPAQPQAMPGETTRQALTRATSATSCHSCHQLMNPIGFGFEHFDGVGRWRGFESGVAVDASGELVGTDADGTFTGLPELGARLAGSGQAQACFAAQLFRYAFGRPEAAADGCVLDALKARGAATEWSLIELLVALARVPDFGSARAAEGGGP